MEINKQLKLEEQTLIHQIKEKVETQQFEKTTVVKNESSTQFERYQEQIALLCMENEALKFKLVNKDKHFEDEKEKMISQYRTKIHSLEMNLFERTKEVNYLYSLVISAGIVIQRETVLEIIKSREESVFSDYSVKQNKLEFENSRLREQISNMENDMKKYQQELKDLSVFTEKQSNIVQTNQEENEKISSLQKKLKEFQKINEQLSINIESYNENIIEKENLIMLLTQQKGEKDLLIKDLQEKIFNFQHKINLESSENQDTLIAKYKAEAEYYIKYSESQELEIEKWKNEYEILQSSNSSSQQIAAKIKKLESKICILEQENNRLRKLSREANQLVDSSQLELQRQQTKNEIIKDLKQKMHQLQVSLDYYKLKSEQTKSSYNYKCREVQSLQTKINEFQQHQFKVILDEKQKLDKFQQDQILIIPQISAIDNKYELILELENFLQEKQEAISLLEMKKIEYLKHINEFQSKIKFTKQKIEILNEDGEQDMCLIKQEIIDNWKSIKQIYQFKYIIFNYHEQ